MSVTAVLATPVIYPQKSIVGVTFARVFWVTSESATSRVDYGTTTAYGSNVTSGSSVTRHILTITGLLANITYHYKITSGVTESSDYTFTTYATPTGTVHTVGSGKDYSTLSSCISAASAGDTCLVYDGSYGAVMLRSGSVGSGYFTVLAQESGAVASTITIPSSGTYIAVKGMELTSFSNSDTNTSYITIENNYIHGGSLVVNLDVTASDSDNWSINNNIFYDFTGKCIQMTGSNSLIDSNLIVDGGNDFFYGGFINGVIRNNIGYSLDPTIPGNSGYHLDFIQTSGDVMNYSLIEGNVEYSCEDSSGNCHFVIFRDQTAPAIENIIIRYNYDYDLHGGGYSIGGIGDEVPYSRIYNNVVSDIDKASDWSITFQNANYGKVFNNILYNTIPDGQYPYYGSGSSGNGNIAFNTGYSGTWQAPYSSESTYSSYRNQDPGFTNYPYSVEIASDAFPVDKAVPLTTVTSGCGTDTLVLADARFFQPGWAGTEADWLAIGTVSNVYQISTVNSYTTGSTTFTGAVSCTNGDDVWLYKKSDGEIVLAGAAPDVGAFEYGVPESPSSVSSTPSGTFSIGTP